MEFLIGAGTHKGRRKSKNQDSMAVRTGFYRRKSIAFLILCDGMGGLAKGEVASGMAVEAFLNWYEKQLPGILWQPLPLLHRALKKQLPAILTEMNQRYLTSQAEAEQMGTTLTSLLVIDREYFFVHIGDSRLYQVGASLKQLTIDHNLGNAASGSDCGKNILVQCIGMRNQMNPQFGRGRIQEDVIFLLASDGFYNQLTEAEIFHSFMPGECQNEAELEAGIYRLMERCRLRGEQDDLSSLAMAAFTRKGRRRKYA